MKISHFSDRQRGRGFSLVEVIIAIGIFAATIVAVIGLLGPISQQVRDLQDTKVANSLPSPILEELNRVGFDFFVSINNSGVGSVNGSISEDDPIELYATADGSVVSMASDPDALAIPEAARYFLIEVYLAAGVDDGENLSYKTDPADAYIALKVDISWPFYIRTGPGDSDFVEVDSADRRNYEYYTAVVAGEPF